jgi:micrococcal nuclease
VKKRDLLLLISTLINVALVFILVEKVQSPVINEISTESIASPTRTTSLESPGEVIGEKAENQTLKKVTKVIDGDTIRLENGQTVRYIGIDTPEKSGRLECYANEATRKNEELVLNKEVKLGKDISETDRYGRLLSYVYEGDTFINEILVSEGYATAVTYPPDVKYSELFRNAERQARENNLGLWNMCGKESDSEKDPSSMPTSDNSQLTTTSSDCSSNLYNCTDFKTHAESQSVFDSCGGAANDIHKLDSDGDGVACESLP